MCPVCIVIMSDYKGQGHTMGKNSLLTERSTEAVALILFCSQNGLEYDGL